MIVIYIVNLLCYELLIILSVLDGSCMKKVVWQKKGYIRNKERPDYLCRRNLSVVLDDTTEPKFT